MYYLNYTPTILKGKVGFLTDTMDEYKFNLKIPYQINELNEKEWFNLYQLKIDLDNLGLFDDTIKISLIEN